MSIITGEKLQEIADVSIITEDIHRFHSSVDTTSCNLCIFEGNSHNLVIRDDHNLDKVKRANIIFVYTHQLKSFFTKIYPRLSSPFILMSHNSDDGIDERFEPYLNEGKIFRWFGQNVAVMSNKLISLPIGVANSQWPHGQVDILKGVMGQNVRKEKLVYMNFNTRTNPGGRLPILNRFKDAPYITVAGNMGFRDYLQELARHVFCISPPGNGLDCHRIWECLYLGVIPVVLKNPNIRYYDDLPILLIDDWKEINPEFLEEKFQIFKSRSFNLEKLDLAYWKKMIYSQKGKLQTVQQVGNCQPILLSDSGQSEGQFPEVSSSGAIPYAKQTGSFLNRKHLIVEGWRFFPHSYAIVNQFQCLEMLKHKDLMLYHRDLPFLNPNWTPVTRLFNEDAELKLRTIPSPPEDLDGDVLFRIGYPYDFRKSPLSKTFVFGTSEWGVIYDRMLWGNIPLQEVLKDSDVGIIVPSNWSKCGFVRSGAEPDRITVIPHGVDPRIFKPAEDLERTVLREKFGWYNSFVFLNIGAMTGNKGIIILLKAFAEIATHYSDVKLVLKGMDSLYSSKKLLTDIKNRLSSSELDIIVPRVEYLGGTFSFADIACLYQAADCYVSPYLAEGFNMPALEGAACGLPVICTEGGPTDDFVTESFALRIKSELKEYMENGCINRLLLMPDIRHLITLMKEVIEDSAWRNNAHISGPVYVNQKFTWEHVTRQLLNTFFQPD